MTIKQFTTSCRRYTNHYADMSECKNCKYCKRIDFGKSAVDCTYDEDEDREYTSVKPMVSGKEITSNVPDFISDIIRNH